MEKKKLSDWSFLLYLPLSSSLQNNRNNRYNIWDHHQWSTLIINTGWSSHILKAIPNLHSMCYTSSVCLRLVLLKHHIQLGLHMVAQSHLNFGVCISLTGILSWRVTSRFLAANFTEKAFACCISLWGSSYFLQVFLSLLITTWHTEEWIAFCCCNNCFLDANILCTWTHLAHVSSRGIVCSKGIVRETADLPK